MPPPVLPRTPQSDPASITQILHLASSGDSAAVNQLLPLVHSELRALAQTYMAQERRGHTLQATSLVNEAYLRLVEPSASSPKDRQQFFALAATVMRHILVDHARAKARLKRGGEAERVSIDPAETGSPVRDADVLSLHDALGKLANQSSRVARVVELKFFAGMKGDQIAEVLGVSSRTVDADWTMARAWLARELASSSGAAAS